jgi:hypothetical protein
MISANAFVSDCAHAARENVDEIGGPFDAAHFLNRSSISMVETKPSVVGVIVAFKKLLMAAPKGPSAAGLDLWHGRRVGGGKILRTTIIKRKTDERANMRFITRGVGHHFTFFSLQLLVELLLPQAMMVQQVAPLGYIHMKKYEFLEVENPKLNTKKL